MWTLINAINDAFRFWDIVPTEVEYNCGTIWIKNENDGKRYAISIIECEGE